MANDPDPVDSTRPFSTVAAGGVPTTDYDGRDAGRVIGGRFRLIEPVGEGGMGTVWKAEQTEPVRRLVAVKLIRTGADSKAVLARFDAERQALAMMDHPNIAKVLDAGVTDDGRPFFVMELVRGVPITRYCSERQLSVPERLALFIPVCQAIQHAHQKGIIHRDVKPSNVLVAEYDSKPVPKVIDFGVAKAAGGRLTDSTLETSYGAIVGTPEYMSPEQAADSADVDTRSDVYALGVLVYELLTGSPPHDRAKLKSAGLIEILRIVREEEPPPPSSKLTGIRVPNVQELDWIVLKALEKDRSRRYESANALAADILRHLANETVSAGPPRAGYRLRKFIRRHRAVVLGSLTVLFALVAGLTGAVWGLIEARHQRDEADKARKLALADKVAADEARAAETVQREQATVARKHAEHQKTMADLERFAKERAAERADGLRLGAEATNALRFDPGLALLLAIEGVKRHPHHLTFAALADAAAALRETKTITNVAAPLAVFPDGKRFACAVTDGFHVERGKARAVTVFDEAGKPGISWPGYGLDVGAIAISPDGKTAATTLIGAMIADLGEGAKKERALYTSRVVYVWDTATGRDRLHLRGHDNRVVSVEFSPDGSRILSTSLDGTARQWNVTTGEPIGPPMAHENSLAFARYSPDGTRILSVSSGRTEYDNSWRDYEKDKAAIRIDPGPTDLPIRLVNTAGRSSGSVSAGDSFAARVWDAATGKQVAGLRRKRTATQFFHTWTVTQGRFSPDGQRVVLAFTDKVAGLWDATKDGPELVLLTGHDAPVNDVSFSSNGKSIMTASDDGKIHEYPVGVTTASFVRSYGGGMKKAIVPDKDDHRWLILGDSELAVWPVQAQLQSAEFANLVGHRGRILATGFLGSGSAVSIGIDGTARIWSLAKPPELAQLVPLDGPKAAAFDVSPDGARLAVAGSGDGATVRILDLRSGRQLIEIGKDAVLGGIHSVRFHPDGSQIVTASDVTMGSRSGKIVNTSAVHVWDAQTGDDLYSFPTHGYGASSAAFLLDGRRIVSVADGNKRSLGGQLSGSRSFSEHAGTVRIWDPTTRKVVHELPERCEFGSTPIEGRDGKLLGIVNSDKAIVYNAENGQVRYRAELAPNARGVVLRSADANAAVWNQRIVRVLSPVGATVGESAFESITGPAIASKDGHWLAVPAGNRVALLDFATGRLVSHFVGHEGPVHGLAFSPDGTQLVSFGTDRTAAVWDFPTGRLRAVHRSPVAIHHAAFRPDGGIVTAGDDGFVRLWPADPVAELQKRLPRDFNSTERLRYDIPGP